MRNKNVLSEFFLVVKLNSLSQYRHKMIDSVITSTNLFLRRKSVAHSFFSSHFVTYNAGVINTVVD